jgi:hypothetical protein
MKKSKYYWFGLIVSFSLIINACSTTRDPGLAQGPIIVPASETPLPAPTGSETPTQIPTTIPTATPIPHPLQIEAMRAREYPGSDITIEETLDPGVNYSRYYVSYLSEGLKIYADDSSWRRKLHCLAVIIFNLATFHRLSTAQRSAMLPTWI